MVRVALILAAAAWVAPGAAQESQPSAADAVALNHEFQSLLEDYLALLPPPVRATEQQVQRWREGLEPQLDQLLERLGSLADRSGEAPDVLLVKALCHAKRAGLYLDQRRALDARYTMLSEDQEPEAVARDNPDLVRERSEAAQRVAREYRAIEDTLERALAVADAVREGREMRLIKGVILAQAAIVEDKAVVASADALDEIDFDPKRLRRLLDDAQALLTAYLEQTPRESGLEWVRGQFYLGVVEYRRALKSRVPRREYYTEVDSRRTDAFERAREIFQALSDPADVLAILKPHEDDRAQRESAAGWAYENSSFNLQSNYSYQAVANYYAASANLYMGLIAAIDPAYEGRPPEERLAAAEGYLDRAVELDMSAPSPDEPAMSLTLNTIPTSYDRVVNELRRAAAEVPQRLPLNDLTFTIGSAFLWDTNVRLLGDNTIPPRDVDQRDSDARFPNVLRINYVVDLDALDRGNEFLRRWQVLAEGRVTSTWNANTTDFNEQFYGGTVNLRYELFGPDVFENIDGAYFHIRYDYDQIVLGNDGFLSINRVRPMFQIVAFDQVLDSSIYMNYEARDYSEALSDQRFNRDGNYFAVGADFRVDLGQWVNAERLWGPERAWGPYAPRGDDRAFRRPLELLLGYELNSNSTDGDEFDYTSHVLSTGVLVPLPYGIDFSFSGVWEWQNYWQHSLLDRQRRFRKDFIQEYGFRAERKFFLTDYAANYEFIEPLKLDRIILTVYGDIRMIYDDSNVVDRLAQQVFEYERVIYGVGVRVDIN